MRVPNTEKKLLDFARERVENCTHSQANRAIAGANNLAFYEHGTDGDGESLYNRTAVHIDRTSSYLYGPGEIRYAIGFDATEGESWLARARAASKYLSREYRRSDADIVFSHGVLYGLIKGCTLMKHNWMDSGSLYPGLDPQLVHPEFFGVEREDLIRLEEQPAMTHTMYLSKESIADLAEGRPDKDEILRKLSRMGGSSENGQRKNWLHQTVLGGTNPVGTVTATGARGMVSVSPASQTDFSPEVMANLLRVDEIWAVDDEREDYTTLQLVEGEILLEGKYRHRNLTGVNGMHPFSKICPDPVAGYFWGRSEVSRVKVLQQLLTERMEDVRRLLKLQVKPSRAFIGFQGITSQKMRAALAPGGFLQEATPGAKIENLVPNIPEELLREIHQLSDMFDEIGGFKPILQGQGEPGVRANAHARTLMRTASPKLRERALRVERDAEASASIVFKLLQAKDARVFVSSEQEQFLLKQMPNDYYVEVDSHSGSPVFIDDARELAFALAKVGAAGPSDVVRMAVADGHMQDDLLASIDKREKARAQFLKEHPELLSKGGKKKAA